jgi:hypothetical protein
MREGGVRLVAAGALLLYVALAVSGMGSQSASFDEPIHLPPGYAALTLNDHRMNPDHPPLVRLIAALPLLFLDVTLDQDDHAWRTSRPWEFGKRFLYRWNDADALLFWGRLPIVALGVALGAAVFAWTRRHWGLPAALTALLLYATSPDMLAHGRIVTNDLGITLFLFLAILAFERVCERVTPARVVGAGVALGAALAAKFSAAALLPMLAALAVAITLGREPLRLELGTPRDLHARGTKLGVLALVIGAMGALAVVVIWASYGFRSELAIDPAANAAFDWSVLDAAHPVPREALLLARRLHLLPEAWVWGFLHFVVHAESRPAFLLGAYSETGWWYYFPVTFAVKTPGGLLVLLAVSILTLRRTRASWRSEAFLWIPVLVYLGLTMTRSINIGHRHLLPIEPFVFAAAGRVARLALPSGRPPRAAWAAAVALLLGWQAVSTLRVHPYYLAYFNELAGGPRNGYRLLVDSNLDWGQDLPGLKAWMERNAVPRVTLCYFGTADPAHHGIRASRLPGYQPPPPSTLTRAVKPGDVVAVSATHLQGVYLDPALLPLMEALKARRPLATIGYSILVYRVDFAWSMP